jgi:hypothetical protein
MAANGIATYGETPPLVGYGRIRSDTGALRPSPTGEVQPLIFSPVSPYRSLVSYNVNIASSIITSHTPPRFLSLTLKTSNVSSNKCTSIPIRPRADVQNIHLPHRSRGGAPRTPSSAARRGNMNATKNTLAFRQP